MWISLLILTLVPLFAQQNSCLTDNALNTRSIYSIGDTLSIEDQIFLYPVCNGSDNYVTGDLFSFSNLNGNSNGGDYKITLISMNATW
tara:strand:- start:736 stop:999 length:264 start_codon:yes stop_codon:yes gene_type:complete